MNRTGIYDATIHNWDLGMSKNSAPMLLLEFACQPPASRPDIMPFAASTYIVFSESAMEWAFRKLEAIGYTGDSLDQLDPNNPPSKGGPHDFAGKVFRVKVEETLEPSYNDPTKMVPKLSCDIVIPTKIKGRIEDRDKEIVEDINVKLAEYRLSREAKKAAEQPPQIYHDDKSHVPPGQRHGNSPKGHIANPDYLEPAGVNGTMGDDETPF